MFSFLRGKTVALFVRSRGGSTVQDSDVSNSTILLPKGYDPLALLDQVESLYNFSGKAAHTLPPGHQKKVREILSII